MNQLVSYLISGSVKSSCSQKVGHNMWFKLIAKIYLVVVVVVVSDGHWHTRHIHEHMVMKSDVLRYGNYRLYRLDTASLPLASRCTPSWPFTGVER